MCRSSRILTLFFVLAATPAFAQARGVGPAGVGRAGVGAPAPLAAPRTGVQPGVAPGVNRGVLPNSRNGVNPGVRPNVFPNVRGGILPGFNRGGFGRGLGVGALRPGFGRFRRGFAGSGLDAVGLGLSMAGDLPYAPFLGGDGCEREPPVIPAGEPPSCVRPLIIKVGRGLRRPPETRVVYGTPPGCGRLDQR